MTGFGDLPGLCWAVLMGCGAHLSQTQMEITASLAVPSGQVSADSAL